MRNKVEITLNMVIVFGSFVYLILGWMLLVVATSKEAPLLFKAALTLSHFKLCHDANNSQVTFC